VSELSQCKFANRLTRAVMTCVVLATATMAVAQAGHLDPTFANKGIFSDSFSTGTNVATVVALQSDGKIVVGGEIGNFGGVLRLNTNGTLDNSFGTGGVVQLKFRVIDNIVTGMAIQPDGKILVSGTGIPGGGDLDRLNPDGSFDTSFGNNGSVFLFPMTPGPLVLQPDGKIVVGSATTGSIEGSPTSQMQRFSSDGQLDTTFGTGGTAPLLSSGAITLQSDGKFLVASLDRYNSNGSLDASFGTFGQVAALAGGSTAVQTDGRIVTAGSITTKLSTAGNSTGFGLQRFNSDGSIDTSFGRRGAVATNFPNSPQTGAGALAIQSNGEIVAAGEAGSGGNQPTGTFALARYLSTGKLDTTFGGGGRVTTGFGSGAAATISAIAIQTDGKIVAVGNANGTSWEVARYLGR